MQLAKAADKADENDVLASVDGVKYLRKDLDAIVSAVMKAQNLPAEQQAEARKHFEQRFVTDFINKTLLQNAAKEEDITVTDDDRKAMTARIEPQLQAAGMTLEQHFKQSPLGEEHARKEFENGLLFDKLLQAKVISKITIDDDAVAKEIKVIQEQNAKQEEANKNKAGDKAAKRAKMEDIKKKLDEGADFAELAKQNSDCPSGQKGGNLGEFRRGMMVKPFEDAAFGQEAGKVGDIIETQFGYHVILVTAKQPAVEAKGNEPAKPETVTASHILVKADSGQPARPVPTEDDVREQLKGQQAQKAVQNYLEELKAKAKVEIAPAPVK